MFELDASEAPDEGAADSARVTTAAAAGAPRRVGITAVCRGEGLPR
jgi:hypothetical protein